MFHRLVHSPRGGVRARARAVCFIYFRVGSKKYKTFSPNIIYFILLSKYTHSLTYFILRSCCAAGDTR